MFHRILPIALVAPLLAAIVNAQGFTPGRLHVARTGGDGKVAIAELTPSGEFVRDIPTPTSFVIHFAFGPNGKLYVADGEPNPNFNHWIYELDGSGNVLGKIEVTDQAQTISFGENGNLLVNADKKLEEYSLTGVKIRELETAGFVRSALISSSGHWFTAYSNFGVDTGGIVEYDPSGKEVRTFGMAQIATLSSPLLLRRPADGAILMWNQSQLHVYDAKGAKVSTTTVGATGRAAIAPDGVIHGSHAGQQALPRAKLDGTPLTPLTLDFAPKGVDVSPYRFQAKVKGTFQRSGEVATTVNETVVLSYWPSAGRAAIQFTDDALKSADLASLFGTTAWVFHGFETPGIDTGTTRLFQGGQFGDAQQTSGGASLAAVVKGSIDTLGAFAPKKAIGSLQRGGASGVFTGSLTTLKLVK